MGVNRVVVRLLDRGWGRVGLAAVTNLWIRQRSSVDASVHWDGCWLRRIGSEYIVDGQNFTYYRSQVATWERRLQRQKSDVADYWYHAGEPRPGDTVIDVGAGIGTDAAVFSRTVGPAGRVLAIEAHPRTFRMLQVTCRWNGLANVVPVHAAVVHQRQTVVIEDQENHESNTVSLGKEVDVSGFRVPGVSLDDICRDYAVTEIGLLKMNIEGAERLAIRGMHGAIQRTRQVCIACHDFRGSESDWYRTRSEVEAFLRTAGFRIVNRDQDPRDYVRDHVHGVRDDAWDGGPRDGGARSESTGDCRRTGGTRVEEE
jgi:FkbM family methyltransferase